MNVRLFRIKLCGDFETLHCSLDITFLQQSLTQFITRVGEVRLELDDFSHQLEAGFAFLTCEQDEAEVIFCLNIIRVQGQLTFELTCGVVELPGLHVDQSGIVVGERRLTIQR